MAGEEVWIIDDNLEVADCLKQYGALLGYNVRTFELAGNALEEIVHRGARPEVVVCDLQGKQENGKHVGMDGNQFFLEAYPHLLGSLRYLITASDEIPPIVNSMHVKVIRKPISPKYFYNLIARDIADLVDACAGNSQ
ncbi:hypothetical protein JW707_02240 [Candidatus Woesearchaeota archaeon]|nr:hypothetical protein [Candidatus Woesearchaeota archaeon]